MVLSDQLVIRGYSSYDAWKPGPMHVQYGDLLPSSGLQEALAPLVSFGLPSNLSTLSVMSLKPVRADFTLICSLSHSADGCKMSSSARVSIFSSPKIA